ncbi:hypothetical protein K1719_000387 [Acacia pycnantha]|nr:hypothetical protein K1719_000387 [Acacia pycnantha]
MERLRGLKMANTSIRMFFEVAKIDELEAQSSQGSFTPSTRMDILSMAIGKPYDLGHVRGEPRGVSAAKYFGRRRRFSYDDENPPPQLVAKIRVQLQDDLLRQLHGELKAMVEEKEHSRPVHESPAHPSNNESYNPPEMTTTPPLDEQAASRCPFLARPFFASGPNFLFKLLLVHASSPTSIVGLAGLGAADVLPIVDSDLRQIAARVVEKAKELCISKSAIQFVIVFQVILSVIHR